MKKKYYRKPYRIKRKKSIFKNRFFWLGILLLIITGSLFYFLFLYPFFDVKEIIISGNEKVKREEIENLVKEQIQTDFKFLKNKNINLIKLNEIDKILLENFPQIARVSSKKELPNAIIIEIEERKPWAVFKQNDNRFFIDKEGVIFDPIRVEEDSFFSTSSKASVVKEDSFFSTSSKASVNDVSNGTGQNVQETPPTQFPPLENDFLTGFTIIQNLLLNKELKVGERIAEKEIMSQIIELESKLKEDLKIPLVKEDKSSSSPFTAARVKELTIVSEERLNAKTSEGWEIYFNLKGDLNWQILKLKAVLENRIPPEKRGNINYIDLRFERVYIFPENYNER